MEHLRTIIKRGAVTRVGGRESDAPPEERPVRIPASQVQAQYGVAPAEELEESFRLRGIFRGGAAPAPVEPYVMADLDLEPDFPLPEAVPVIVKPPTVEPSAEPIWTIGPSRPTDPPDAMQMPDANILARTTRGRILPPRSATASITSGTPWPFTSRAK